MSAHKKKLSSNEHKAQSMALVKHKVSGFFKVDSVAALIVQCGQLLDLYQSKSGQLNAAKQNHQKENLISVQELAKEKAQVDLRLATFRKEHQSLNKKIKGDLTKIKRIKVRQKAVELKTTLELGLKHLSGQIKALDDYLHYHQSQQLQSHCMMVVPKPILPTLFSVKKPTIRVQAYKGIPCGLKAR